VEPQREERRLTTILSADVAGYSRLMAADESGTLAQLKAHRKELIEPKTAEYHGRVVKLMGDGTLMEFTSVVDAVRFAVDVQGMMAERNARVREDRRVIYRMGINIGDIIVEGDDIYGDGVNVAARLEGLADPGGICISRPVHTQIKGKVDYDFEDMGERQLKNIPDPIRVYRLADRQAQEVAKSVDHFHSSIGLDFTIPDYPSIAVLPFTVMSADPEQEFFADGVCEDIITALSKISRILVVARNSTFTYKGKAVDVKQVSREQGVRYVLEGSVRKAGDRVRVAAQLIDATTGLHLWAERYDRKLEDIFAVQDEITREIVVALDVQLREGEQHRVWSSGTKNLEAWECVRLATDDVLGGNEEKRPRATELIEQALALDPNYAIAWAMRGWLYFTEADVGGGIGNHEQFEKAQVGAFRSCRRALEADPNCAEAYGVLALTHLNAGEHDAAIEMTEKAIALAPNSPEILGGVASAVMRKSGRPDRGAECVKKAMRLSPFYRPGLLRALGNNYRLSGRLEEAVACYRESLKRESGYLAPYVNLASVLGELGGVEEAREAAREVLRQEPGFSISGYAMGLSYRNRSDLERITDGLRKAGLPE
jgi:adenylate cyclase